MEADPQKLAAYGLNIDDLRTLLGNINVSQPKGNFDGPELDYTINDNDQIQDPKDYLNTVIAYQNGAPVYLRDVATVTQAAQNIEQGAWFNGTPAIVLNVQRQPGANVIATVNQIKQQLPQLLATPARRRCRSTVVADSTGVIRSSVYDAAFELRAVDRAGGAGDLRVPAQSAGDDHSEHLRAGVADRHAGDDVRARTIRSTTSR